GGGGTHPLEQLEDPEPADLVGGVLEDPPQRHGVLDVGRLQELQAAVFDARDVAASQLDLQEVAVVRGPEQHGLSAQRCPSLAMLEHLATDLVALLGLVETRLKGGTHGAGPLGPQGLLVAMGSEGDGGIRGVEDGLRGAIVLFETNDGGAVEPVRELEDVANRG